MPNLLVDDPIEDLVTGLSARPSPFDIKKLLKCGALALDNALAGRLLALGSTLTLSGSNALPLSVSGAITRALGDALALDNALDNALSRGRLLALGSTLTLSGSNALTLSVSGAHALARALAGAHAFQCPKSAGQLGGPIIQRGALALLQGSPALGGVLALMLSVLTRALVSGLGRSGTLSLTAGGVLTLTACGVLALAGALALALGGSVRALAAGAVLSLSIMGGSVLTGALGPEKAAARH